MSDAGIHTLTGAYALDAVDEFERRQFQAHLNLCADCAQEVRELRATGAKLGIAVAQRPPETLRRHVMVQVAVTRQESPAGRSAARTGAPTGTHTGRRVRLTASVAGLAAAAALLLGVASIRTGHVRDTARTQLAQVQAQHAPMDQIAAAADARAGSAPGVRGGTAFVLVSQQLDKAVLLVSGLPTPAGGHTYQAWLIGQGHLRSVGLLRITATRPPEPLQFDGLGGAAKIGLTIEPDGGSPQPTTTPVVLFDLPP